MSPARELPPSPVETVVVPRTTDLGDGFAVRRALPSTQRRMVGPFVAAAVAAEAGRFPLTTRPTLRRP